MFEIKNETNQEARQPELHKCRLIQYGKYVDSLQDTEDAPGCESCAENRKVLEQAWQVVANEYFDPKAKFSQTWWAGELERSLKEHGGMYLCHFVAIARLHTFATFGMLLC